MKLLHFGKVRLKPCLSAGAAALICMGLNISSVQGMSFAVQPYTQNPAETGMTIMWVTNEPSRGHVEVGRTPKKLARFVAANNIKPDICKVRVCNLQPGTKYYYRVRAKSADGTPIESEVGTFTTLDSRADTVRAIVFNDLHMQWDAFPSVVEKCRDFDYSLAFFNGDIWYEPSLSERSYVLETLSIYNKGLKPGVLPVYVRGNHEWRGGFSQEWWTLFDLPNLKGRDPWGEQRWYFSFTQGPVHFTVLDCGEDFDKKMEVFQPYREKEAEWLKQEVASPEFKSATFRVLVMHIPLYDDIEWSTHCRKLFEPILNSAKVDMAICGHIHTYNVFDPKKGCGYPYPVVVGGDPYMKGATVIKLEATRKDMTATMLNSDGKVVGSISVQKKAAH